MGKMHLLHKILSFKIRGSQLKHYYESNLTERPKWVKGPRAVNTTLKRGPGGRKSEHLYMGFKFAKFAQAEDKVKSVKVAHNTMLDGHLFRLQVSKRRNRNGTRDVRRKRSDSKGKTELQLPVRNVAFEATCAKERQLS